MCVCAVAVDLCVQKCQCHPFILFACVRSATERNPFRRIEQQNVIFLPSIQMKKKCNIEKTNGDANAINRSVENIFVLLCDAMHAIVS